MQFVVIFGTLGNGIQTVHGPFDSREKAEKWANDNGSGQSFVVYPLMD